MVDTSVFTVRYHTFLMAILCFTGLVLSLQIVPHTVSKGLAVSLQPSCFIFVTHWFLDLFECLLTKSILYHSWRSILLNNLCRGENTFRHMQGVSLARSQIWWMCNWAVSVVCKLQAINLSAGVSIRRGERSIPRLQDLSLPPWSAREGGRAPTTSAGGWIVHPPLNNSLFTL